jgi:drug/metabolite transporter (DMT)-like permease
MTGNLCASIASNAEPVFVALISIVIVGESVRPIQAVGASLVILAILAMQVAERRRVDATRKAPVVKRG